MAETETENAASTGGAPELERRYHEEIRPELKEELGLDSIMAVPELTKITVNVGLGQNEDQRDRINAATEDLKRITSQQPVVTRAKKAVAAFDIREGDPIGVKVTLRKTRMYAFLERLIHLVIPRFRDFRGLDPDAMDGSGNFSMGIENQTVFPGIDIDEVEYVNGMDVCISTSADNDRDGLALLRALGMPFQEV